MSDHPGESSNLDATLEYLRLHRGFDFSSYKRPTLTRRFEKRMQAVGVPDIEAYQDYLEVHQDEFQLLFNTILINVTSFFRDPEAWEYIQASVIPAILEERQESSPIRIWVAGCASGEEACTVAMLLAEAMGSEDFRFRVKIYATDIDEEALASSRTATYKENDLEAVPQELRQKYFERVNGNFVFDRDLRRSLIYGRHDLIQDAPISRINLLLCRNTLMYFNAEVQDRIIQRFHFALGDGGYLFLGKSETMIAHNDLYRVEDLKNRIFSKAPRPRIRDRGFMFGGGLSEISRVESNLTKLIDLGFDSTPVAQILLDTDGRLVQANERARALFSISRRDHGLPIQDLDVSFRPVELRSGIEQALSHKRPVRHTDVLWTAPGGEGYVFDVKVAAVSNDAGNVLGTTITFEDVTALKRLQGEVQTFRQELETAYEEVQSTNEELETTNEELQSTVEELETTNEELQSTNEELETMNEETQSTNEELETINQERQLRADDLNRANSLMELVLASLREGVIVLDQELQIVAWNYQSEDLWGLRADEVIGRHLLNLDIGLPLDQFRSVIRSCLSSRETQLKVVEAVNRRGRKVSCKVELTPLKSTSEGIQGVLLLISCTPLD